jgi:hypothetical protein
MKYLDDPLVWLSFVLGIADPTGFIWLGIRLDLNPVNQSSFNSKHLIILVTAPVAISGSAYFVQGHLGGDPYALVWALGLLTGILCSVPMLLRAQQTSKAAGDPTD